MIEPFSVLGFLYKQRRYDGTGSNDTLWDMFLLNHKIVEYTKEDLDELTLAYAISIHKSQGSEFPAVIIPIANQHFMLLQRNLIYTAITRARKLAILLCQKRALHMALNADAKINRKTALAPAIRTQFNDQ